MPNTMPLAGLTIVEIGHSVAAPYAGLILAALGADVIKVENPQGGDYARGWGPPFYEGTATVYHSLNRDKRGIAVDLADADALDALKRLVVERADGVIQNLRPGIAARYGLDAPTLLARKPDLVYATISAFGADGPLASYPGYDPLMQAFGGIMSVTGEGGDRPPVRVGVSMIDMGAGLWSVIGMLATFYRRAQTARGGAIETSLYETALAWMTVPMAGYLGAGDIRRPHGSGVGEIVPYQCFLTQGGWLMIAAGNDKLFRQLCTVLSLPELADDPRFRYNAGRVEHRGVLLPMLEQAVAPLAIAELQQRLDAAGVPNAALQDVAQVAGHAQTHATGMVQHGPAGSPPLVGIPLTFDGERPAYRRTAPRLGEHNDGVLGAPAGCA
jgi:crotonobetainyl-CoA:carnitine CoA-transferase CaiB-like acyl-CoA transferase